ncbi:Smr domain-containing protein [Entamoeba marina]
MGCCGSKHVDECNETTPLNVNKDVESPVSNQVDDSKSYQTLKSIDENQSTLNNNGEDESTEEENGELPEEQNEELNAKENSIEIEELVNKLDSEYEKVEEMKRQYEEANANNADNSNELLELYQKNFEEFEGQKYKITKEIFDASQLDIIEENTICLNGLRSDGAVTMLDEQVEERRELGKQTLKVIFGKEHPSESNHVSIKEEIIKKINSLELQYEQNDNDEGFITIQLKDKEQ